MTQKQPCIGDNIELLFKSRGLLMGLGKALLSEISH